MADRTHHGGSFCLRFGALVVTAFALLALAADRSPATAATMSERVLQAPGIFGLSSADGVSAALVDADGSDATAELWVGRGAKLEPFDTAWTGGQVNVGTDADGRPVLVYARCGTTSKRSCDLRFIDLETRNDRPVPHTRAAGRGEVEGVMDRGAVAFRTSGKRTAGVWQRSATGRPHLVTRTVGSDLAYRGGFIAQAVRGDSSNPDVGLCDGSEIRLYAAEGPSNERIVGQTSCGLDGQSLVAPSFAGNYLFWGFARLEQGAAYRLRLSDLSAGLARLPLPLGEFVATGLSGGYLLGSDPETDEARGIYALRGLKFRACKRALPVKIARCERNS